MAKQLPGGAPKESKAAKQARIEANRRAKEQLPRTLAVVGAVFAVVFFIIFLGTRASAPIAAASE